MGCFVLEPKAHGKADEIKHVPGTAVFNEDPAAAAVAAAFDGVDLTTLKRAPGRDDLILIPQPSNDPNDPLLWPMWKKQVFFWILIFGTCLVGAAGPLIAADQRHIAGLLGVSANTFAQILSSWFVFALAIATIFFQVATVKLGKRPIYLFSSVLLCVSAVWASYAGSIGSFAAARMIQALSMAPLEFLVGASINDVFYVHERGIYIAIWTAALLVGINCTPVVAGQVLKNPELGYVWVFRYFAIACGVLVILQFLFMPESTFVRAPVVPAKTTDWTSDHEKGERAYFETGASTTAAKRTFLQELNPVNGIYKTKTNVFLLFSRPFLMLFTPVVFWGGLVYGLGVTWLVMLAVTISVIFSSPPYNFISSSVGLTYISPVIGAFLGTLIAGPITDWSAKILSRRNHGIYEPEFKLLPVAFYLFFGVFGFVGYGWTLSDGAPWIGPVVFFGICNFAIVLGTTAGVSYIVDCNRHTTDAALGALIFWKNIWSFALTWNFTEQILHYGPRNSFAVIAAVIAFTSLCTIPMYIYGKKARSWTHRHIRFSEEDEMSAVAH